MRRRLGSTGGLFLGLVLVVAVEAAAAGSAEEELATVKSALEERGREAERLAEAAEKLEAELTRLRRERIQVAAQAQEAEAALTALEDELATLDRSIARKREKLVRTDASLPRFLGALALLGRDPPTALLAMPATAQEAMQTAALFSHLLPKLDTRAARLRDELTELETLRGERAEVRRDLAAAEETLAAKRAHLDDLMRETRARQRDIAGERTALAREMASLAAQAETLQDLVRRLTDAQATREAELRAARRAHQGVDTLDTPGGAGSPTSPTGEAVEKSPEVEIALSEPLRAAPPEPPDRWPSISEARGSLRRPVAGPVVAGFGSAEDDGGASRGIVIETRQDAQVVAPFAGRVAFAGPFRGYGQLLIMEHSEGYHTLLAGFSRIDCVVGQWLQAGEPVGVVGGRGEAGSRLYVELRQDGKPVDPTPWLVSGNRKVSE